MYHFHIKDPLFLPHAGCDIILELGQGEGIVLTGPNGIGKSTLFNALVKEYQDVNQLSLVDQRPLDFFYDRAITDVKKILLQTRAQIFDEETFCFLWEGFGLHEKKNRLLSELSGGERQTLKICVGLSKKAEVYLLDEPFQSLDLNRKDFLTRFINENLREKYSLIIIEHELQYISSDFTVIPLEMDGNVLKTGKMWTT